MSCLSGVRASIGGGRGRGRGRGDQEEHRCLVGPSHHRLRLLLFNLEQTNQEEGGGRRIHNRALRTQHTCMQSGRPVEHYPHKQTDRQADLLDEQTALTYLRVAAGNLPAGTTQLNLRSEPLDY